MVKVSVKSGFASWEDAWELLPGGTSRYLGGSNTRKYESTPDSSIEVEGECILRQTEYESGYSVPSIHGVLPAGWTRESAFALRRSGK